MSYNRLYNTRNTAQGTRKKVLALCSAGLLRSPTVAWVLSNPPYDYNTRAAGVAKEYALVVVDQYLLCWADEIVCVEQSVADALSDICTMEGIDLTGIPIVTLDIPDIYRMRDPNLVKIVEDQYRDHIHAASTTSGDGK